MTTTRLWLPYDISNTNGYHCIQLSVAFGPESFLSAAHRNYDSMTTEKEETRTEKPDVTRRRFLKYGAGVVVVGAAAAAGYYYLSAPLAPSTPMTTVTTAPATTTATVATASSTLPTTPETLVIDDQFYPASSMNQLLAVAMLPWPNFNMFTHFQPLVIANLRAEFEENKIEFLPCLAESWDISPEGKSYAFNLRKGVKFDNGDPFNSYNVWVWLHGFYWLSGKSNGFMYGVDLFDMSKVEYDKPQLDVLTKSGLANPTSEALAIMENRDWPIYCEGQDRIVLNLAVPFAQPFLFGMLMGHQGLIYDAQYLLDHGGYGDPGNPNPYFNENVFPGTGPYKVDELVVNSYVKYSKNPFYWGSSLTKEEIKANPAVDPGHVDHVVINTKPDDFTRYTDLVAGTAHMAGIAVENFSKVQTNPGLAWAEFVTSARNVALRINCVRAPTNNKMVRQAIVHAIDYNEIMKRAHLGKADRFFGPNTPNYGEFYNPGNLPPYERDLDQAKKDLEQAGFPGGKGLPKLEHWVLSGVTSEVTMATIIQSNMRDIGIETEIKGLLDAAFYPSWGPYDFNLKHANELPHFSFFGGGGGYAPDYLAPTNYWIMFVSKKSPWGNNEIYTNPVVEAAVDKFSQTADVNEIIEALKLAEKQLYDDAPVAWIDSPKLLGCDGSYVWNNKIVKSAYFDPHYTGVTEAPLFNTVVFVGEDW
jgi:peptide/nickel transport system substrate-binding protein